MPSSSTKWRDLVTIVDLSTISVSDASPLLGNSSYEWAKRSTLWEPKDIIQPLPEGYIRGASVSELYPWYVEENVQSSLVTDLITGVAEVSYFIPDVYCSSKFTLEDIRLGDFVRPPDIDLDRVTPAFALYSVELASPPNFLDIHDISPSFVLDIINVGEFIIREEGERLSTEFNLQDISLI